MAILSHEPNGPISTPGARRRAAPAVGVTPPTPHVTATLRGRAAGPVDRLQVSASHGPEVRSEMTTNEAGMCLTPKELRI
jgi:hypothetical protein